MGASPIHLAAFNSLDVFESIIDAGGNLQARDLFGRTPLHWAAQPGRFDVVHHILSLDHSDEAINATDDDGWTVICRAARGPSGWGLGSRRPPVEVGGVVRLLLEGGASRTVEVTAQGQKWTPLKIARYHRAPTAIIGLLEYGLAWDGQSKKEDEHDVASNPDDETRPATRDEKSVCDGCFSGDKWIYGFRYNCKTCGEGVFEHCFICYPRRALGHLPDHEFEQKGPEFEEARPEVGEDDGDTSDTSSDTDSDAESDS